MSTVTFSWRSVCVSPAEVRLVGRAAAVRLRSSTRSRPSRPRGPRPARSVRRGPAAAQAPASTAASSTATSFASERQAAVVARIDGRHRLERRRELERLAFLDDDVADVGRVDRLDAAFAQRLVDRAGDEAVCHVVQNLIAEPLAHDLRRHLAGPEPGILAARL